MIDNIYIQFIVQFQVDHPPKDKSQQCLLYLEQINDAYPIKSRPRVEKRKKKWLKPALIMPITFLVLVWIIILLLCCRNKWKKKRER